MSSFIDNVIQNGTKMHNVQLNSVSKKTISELYHHLKHAYHRFDHVFQFDKIEEYIHIHKQNIDSISQIAMPKTFSSSAFPKQFVATIQKTSRSMMKFHYLLKEKFVTIYFVLPEVLNEINVSAIYRKVEIMIMWLHMIQHYANPKCSREITIYIYATHLKKTLPVSSEIVLDWEHVNTAFTRGCNERSEVVIFRAEEWFKVFIHETMHCFGLDFLQDEMTKQTILNMFYVNSDVNMFEAYVEFWAELINIMFYIFMNDRKSRLRKTIFLSNFERLMNLERHYSILQLVKVLRHMNLTYTDIIDEPLSVRRFKENSNVFAYYILECIFYYYINEMLEWCKINNTNTLQFRGESQKRLCEFIRKRYRNKRFLQDIETVSINSNPSLRMSLFDNLAF